MAPPNVDSLAKSVKTGSARDREKAVDELGSLLSPLNRNPSLAELKDHSYHNIFEAIFSFALQEKSQYYDKKTAAAGRLTKCATAVRNAATRGTPKLKQKTLKAAIDHITQVLPGPNGDYVAPLLQDYVKALAELLSRPAHVELLALNDAAGWTACADLLIDLALYVMPQDGDLSSTPLSRNSPIPGNTFSLRSTGRSSSSSQSQRRSGYSDGGVLRDVLDGLHHLVSGTNAPLRTRYKDIIRVMLRILKLKHLSLGSVQTLCFIILNAVFSAIQAEEVAEAKALVGDMIPLMTYWWRAEKVSQDELIRALRNEISKSLFLMHLHLEHLACRSTDSKLRNMVMELAETFWLEYAKRSEAFRLQFIDITFDLSLLTADHLRNPSFGLRPHNLEGESQWALVQNLATLESILLKSRSQAAHRSVESDEQPRKKRRTQDDSSRLGLKLKAKDLGTRRTALQLVPFIIARQVLTLNEVSDLLNDLSCLIADKDTTTAAWALVACASCASISELHQRSLDVWRQIWHLSVRSISLPGTSRAACVLLHSLLQTEFLPYHELSEELDTMVTAADISGPATLSDTSLALMNELFHIRSIRLPNTSQTTCHHIIRWIFLKWNPSEALFASFHASHVPVLQLVNLLRTCCGMQSLSLGPAPAASGASLSEAWKLQREQRHFNSYLLLLQNERSFSPEQQNSRAYQTPPTVDPSSFYASKKLILELFAPKVEDMNELCTAWTKKTSEGGIQISLNRFYSVLCGVIAGVLLLPQIDNLNTAQSSTIQSSLMSVIDRSMTAANVSVEPQSFNDLSLRTIRLFIPETSTASFGELFKQSPGLLSLLSRFYESMSKQQSGAQSSFSDTDLMDIDQEFDSQTSRSSSASAAVPIPRQNIQLRLNSRAFYVETKMRLSLMRIIHEDEGQVGLVPDAFVENLIELDSNDLFACQGLLIEVFSSDLVVSPENANHIIERLGEFVSRFEYQSCEVAMTTCIEVIDGLHQTWLQDTQHLSDAVGDLYNYLVKVSLPKNGLSPTAQISFSRLLLTLLRVDPDYGTNQELSSCRTILLSILKDSAISVKCYIGDKIAGIFELYILKLHDEVFVDVLSSLPSDPQDIAGIAFRLLALSNLACRWSTLLRRCTYHIFETPGKISHSLDYATRCLADVSQKLQLSSPKELFSLFSRQLLYTWLESDKVDDIPFSIFGFTDLAELLRSAQAEATGFMVMRGQQNECAGLAKRIGLTEAELIKANFATAVAYSMMYGDSPPEGEPSKSGEEFIEQKLSRTALSEARFVNFVDIVAAFFDLIDQDSPIEKAFMKQKDLIYAGNIMKTIKDISHSMARLPPSQQPIFKARFLIIEIRRLCEGTDFDFRDMWTPPVVVFITRRLLDTVKPALGSLHACSVLRKIRILICFAGKTALESYVLEMLLNAIRTFIIDPECADDALGISQYLLAEGSQYLMEAPSFLAGYALSTLASLRVFLESSQASTTQESQFKATMGKAQKFHGWFTNYLSEYNSPVFKSPDQSKAFKSITDSAAHIRSSGNAERGTAESKLLLDILHDSTSRDQLLDEPSRRLALGLLCNDFAIPAHCSADVINNDELAIEYASEVWKSCKTLNLGHSYLSWAGRVVGRAFSASGSIPDGVLRETRLDQYQKIAPDSNGSEMGLLSLLQDLTSDPDSLKAGLAEAALRKAVSQALIQEDEPLIYACRKSLQESLFTTMQWGEYRSPPSEMVGITLPNIAHGVWSEDVASRTWLSYVSVHLAQSVPQSIILSVLPSILFQVQGFAEQAFPFVVHLVLLFQMDQQQTVKRSLSGALKQWLASTDPAGRDNIKLLLNTLLYLRTQEYPKESSIADRAHWLDIDYAQASSAASICGMYKSALLFVELLSSETSRSSRRSSAARESDVNNNLLSIFENLDDPDAYYGLPEEANLSSVLARAEYENEGTKSLAFRGAQYDSNLRLRSNTAESDAQAMVKALNTLGLSGLSHSLLQTQQSIGAAASSLESTFGTARRLEMWHLPAPTASDHHSVVVYKAFQSMHQATDASVVRANVYDGFQKLIENLNGQGLTATSLRKRLGALASLSELDGLMNVADSTELSNLLDVFKSRGQWMDSGLYDDVSQILSCRSTSLSMLSQHTALLRGPKLDVAALRQMEIRSMLLSSGVHRYHQATQESLNISTALSQLIPVCDQLGLVVDASVKMEVANSLWDHGEMSSSIRMLQGIDKESALKKQTIPVNRSDLLSKIGHQVSVARLEKPQDIQKKYLEPALKELKSNTDGKAAGSVYHQFAMFCDGQLQDPAGLEDLARLQSLKQGKSDEVAELQSLISSTRDTQLRTRYSHVLSKEKQWLNLDEQELRRVEQTRSEFVRLSLENYLLSLIASDEHNNDALRFTALWLERSAEDATNKAVSKHLGHVPTRKFAALMNQLSSRLQNLDTQFQKLLLELITNICTDHPYHGMYQIWSGTKAKVQQKDDVQVQRVKATERVAQRLATSKRVGDVWLAIDKTSKYYHLLAMDRNTTKYKSGAKIQLKDVAAGNHLVNCLAKYHVPPPTMTVELSAVKDYSDIPTISKLEPSMTIASGVSAPKIITAVGSNGVRYKQLVKGGHDDLRQDAIMEQVFAAVSSLLKLHRATQQRNLGIRTYKVLPLTASSGLIEFVPNTIPLHEFLMPAHERYYPKDLKGSQCRKEIFNVQSKTVEARIAMYRKVTDKFHPVMRYFFMENFKDPDEWFVKRLAYTRSTAAISMLGHVLGVGDRHGHNILLDHKTGEVVHIDLGVAFEAGRILPVPELVPFRLTRDIVDGMGITKTEGVFRRCCEFTLDALREEQYSIMTILDVLRYDPLYNWSISPLRLAKLQKARNTDDGADEDTEQNEAEMKKGKKGSNLNEPSEADRALEVVRKKLSKTLSVTATVNDLINQSVDESNLAVLYSGWAAYA